jgi:hypothetical protein
LPTSPVSCKVHVGTAAFGGPSGRRPESSPSRWTPLSKPVELRSIGQLRAAVSTWTYQAAERPCSALPSPRLEFSLSFSA